MKKLFHSCIWFLTGKFTRFFIVVFPLVFFLAILIIRNSSENSLIPIVVFLAKKRTKITSALTRNVVLSCLVSTHNINFYGHGINIKQSAVLLSVMRAVNHKLMWKSYGRRETRAKRREMRDRGTGDGKIR